MQLRHVLVRFTAASYKHTERALKRKRSTAHLNSTGCSVPAHCL